MRQIEPCVARRWLYAANAQGPNIQMRNTARLAAYRPPPEEPAQCSQPHLSSRAAASNQKWAREAVRSVSLRHSVEFPGPSASNAVHACGEAPPPTDAKDAKARIALHEVHRLVFGARWLSGVSPKAEFPISNFWLMLEELFGLNWFGGLHGFGIFGCILLGAQT